ncbi:G-type lectin S-receptor-like serine/threonine-protein kinase LECRK3 [Corylus avellana]|uniref:G-type lectin S-receptor-like serine/threonine-protein kinase LECRK3 n=1 Tax=Corylus avellana TaxID=13451 RepID=UPI001E228055|nr:G-type lectin S-receptor-like serine/threonine-protein kinase LECRK3 [Corylus avellana]
MMPILFLPFLLLSAIFAQQGQSLVKRGSFLTPSTNSSWPSPSGLYAFGFYKQGSGYAVGIFLAGLPQKTVVWTADRDKPPVSSDSKLNFTSDGRLVLQSAQGAETSLASFPEGASSLSMLDTGNFVLLNSANQTVWQSFDYPTDTFLPTQNLSHGQVLYSSVSDTNKSTGIFRVLMQEDGWLAMYPVGTPYTLEYGYGGPGIDGQKNDVVLQLEDDGHLYLINGAGVIIVNMTAGYATKDVVYRLTIDPDGILRLYSHDMNQNGDWTVKWFTPDDNVCKPKGLCGINGYCVVIDLQVGCKCLPQFESVNKEDRSSGCQRNFTAESCESDRYAMEPVLNTVWENNNYSIIISTTQDNCGEACLQDCNCEAALFKDGVCTKQRLPLRFGRRDQTDSTVALIKVGTSTVTIDGYMPKERKKERRLDILIVGVSLLAFALVVLAISGIAVYRNRVWSYKVISNHGNTVLGEDVAPKSFTYAQLEKVTGGFKEELGRGAFGTVYKGAIWNGVGQRIVAVKRLDKLLAEREREFHTEMKVIGRTHHKNLVRLLGYCHDGPNRLLVYEYMSNGSLADVLFTPEKQPSWNERMEIARNIARGILYLHEECEPQIIHCDVKPQNILMDENRRPKISDFGLSKLMKADQTKTFTHIRGTKGYVAPEWHRKMPVTVKVDVYSFGIVLLEIICCRKSVDLDLPEEEAILEEWVYQCFESCELSKLVNNEEVDKRQLERITKVGLWCILDEPSLRPSMKKVLLMLEGTVDIPVPPSPTSFLSTI